MTETTNGISDMGIEDIAAFRRDAERHLAGEISASDFKSIHAGLGIYEQRETGTYMVRVRSSGGVFTTANLRSVADLASEYGNGRVHVTTRQNLQIHGLRLKEIPALLEHLLAAGLSFKGGGGNNVRSIAACPNAGICTNAPFDVTPYAQALTGYLLGERNSFGLPRKFKIAFSGCSNDCALSSVSDLGFFAHVRDGQKGFSVYAGGGMGAHSTLAAQIEEFISGESVFQVAEAVKRLFEKNGDRTNRHRARLRYVLERFGADEFRRLYASELEAISAEGIQTPEIVLEPEYTKPVDSVPSCICDGRDFEAWCSYRVASQKHGFNTAEIALALGDISASTLTRIAELAEELGQGEIRTTKEQNLVIRALSDSNVYSLYNALNNVDERFTSSRTNCVSCVGAATCRIGVCRSHELASVLQTELDGIDLDTPILISGCHNACSHHPIAGLGLYGGASRVNGRLVPYYHIVVGGKVGEGNSALARLIGKVPARNVPALFREFFDMLRDRRDGEESCDMSQDWTRDLLCSLLDKHSAVPAYEDAPEFYKDFGSDQDFAVARS